MGEELNTWRWEIRVKFLYHPFTLSAISAEVCTTLVENRVLDSYRSDWNPGSTTDSLGKSFNFCDLHLLHL